MKPIAIISSPIKTRSGFGDLSRSFCRDFIAVYKDIYDIKLVSLNWGMTPLTADVADIEQYILQPPMQMTRQPELHIHIGVTNEAQNFAKYNITYTASAECNITSKDLLDGANRMQLLLATSNHVKQVYESTVIEEKTPDGRTVATHKLNVPAETLIPSVDLNIYKKTSELHDSVVEELIEVKEKFCFLFVGQWLKGDVGEDRKNIGLLIKIFGETFKNTVKANQPALILKTSGAGFSILDREECLVKIKAITDSVGPTCPNVYLLHGDLSAEEMNSLYNHPKIKSLVGFYKGEGLGISYQEFSVIDKPIIASGWSGPLDLLTPEESILVAGELKQVSPSSVYEPFIIPQASWFDIDRNAAASALMWLFKNYEHFYVKAKKLGKRNRELFNKTASQARIKEIFDKYVPAPAQEVQMKLPSLKKLNSLPVLKKLNVENA